MIGGPIHDPFGRSRLPPGHLDAPARVRLLLKAAEAMEAGKPVPEDAAKLLGKALTSAYMWRF